MSFFSQLDTDRNGNISLAETGAFLKYQGWPDHPKVLERFAQTDLNQDGSVSPSEFDSSLKNYQGKKVPQKCVSVKFSAVQKASSFHR